MSRSLVGRRLAACALGCAFFAFVAPPGALAVEGKGTLVWARNGDATSLDPQRKATPLSVQIWRLVYDTLLAFDEDGRVRPNLARSYEVSRDGREIVVEVRDAVRCHDGTPFDANDVKYTVDRAIDEQVPSATRGAWGPVTGAEILDRLTVRITLSEPFGPFLPFLADPLASMICDSSAALGEAFGATAAVGSGPWKIVRWTRGEELVLDRNDDYRNYGHPYDNARAPHLARLVIRQVRDAGERLAGLRSGAFHIAEPPLAEAQSLAADPSIGLVVAGNAGQNVFLEFVTSRPPFNDVRARRAIALALNIDGALDLAFGGLVGREYCPAPAGAAGSDPEFCAGFAPAYDPIKARALLLELGHGSGNPLEVVLAGWSGGGREALFEAFARQLRGVGIEVSVEMTSINKLTRRLASENKRTSGPAMIALIGWSWFDADILYQLWHSPGAFGGYTSRALDALLEATRTTHDPHARLEAIRAVERYLLENVVQLPVYSQGWMWLYAVRSEVRGFRVGRFNLPVFNDVRM